MQRATATGNAIVISLATLFPDAGIDISDSSQTGPSASAASPSTRAGKTEPKEFTPVAPGSYTSAAIIMLTDGQRTTGVDPLDAAKMAADRGVRVYTVGIGTVDGETIGFEGWSMRVRLDEETLKAIANKTSAEYFYAGTANDLKKVYEHAELAADGGEEGNRDLRPVRDGRGGAGAAVGRPVAALVQPHPVGTTDVRSHGQGRPRHRRQWRHRPGHGDGPGRGRRARGGGGAQRAEIGGRRRGA